MLYPLDKVAIVFRHDGKTWYVMPSRYSEPGGAWYIHDGRMEILVSYTSRGGDVQEWQDQKVQLPAVVVGVWNEQHGSCPCEVTSEYRDEAGTITLSDWKRLRNDIIQWAIGCYAQRNLTEKERILEQEEEEDGMFMQLACKDDKFWRMMDLGVEM